MLTSYQASPIAYWADTVPDVDRGTGPYCSGCADILAGGLEESGEHDELMIHYYRTPRGFQPASRYGVEEAFGCSGVDCERCGEPIVESDHSWLEAGEECPECGHVVECTCGGVGYGQHISTCPAVANPNPPVPRWVPCSRCGAGDGEPHRNGCPEVTSR